MRLKHPDGRIIEVERADDGYEWTVKIDGAVRRVVAQDVRRDGGSTTLRLMNRDLLYLHRRFRSTPWESLNDVRLERLDP